VEVCDCSARGGAAKAAARPFRPWGVFGIGASGAVEGLLSETVSRLNDFVAYAKSLDGDEKGEAQVFCDRLFKAFDHAGYKEAGASLEFRIKKKSSKGTSFADLIWKPRVLIEMKKRGEKLHLHPPVA
jgi:hypothetical protein